MFRFMEAVVTTKAMTPCLNHYRRWKESLRNAKKFPAGVKPNLTGEEIKEWFYRSFFCPHCNSFLTAEYKIETSLMEEIFEFVRLRQKEDFDNDTLDRLTTNQNKHRNNDRHNYNRRNPRSHNAHHNGSHNSGGEHKPYRRITTYRQPDNSKHRPARKAYPENNGRHRDYPSSHCQHDCKPYSEYCHCDDNMRDDHHGANQEFYCKDKWDYKIHKPCQHT